MVEQTVTIRTVLEDTIATRLTKVNSAFAKTVRGVDQLRAGLAPLNNQFTQLGSVLAAGFGAREAINLAKEQVTQERRLLQALGDRVAVQQELLGVASELQEVTGIGDEALIPVATLLANMGVSAAEIPRALSAAVDTSAALNIELRGAAQGVGLALTSGRAGQLTRVVPEFQKLQQAGTLASEALDVLEEKFAGAAAAAADSDFGDFQRSLNRIGDLGEEVGKSLIKILLPALEVIEDAFKGLVETLQTGAFQSILAVLIELAPALTELGLIVGSVTGGLVALQTASLLFGPLIGAVNAVAAAFVGVLAAVTPIGLAIAGVAVTLKLFPGLVSRFASLFEPIVGYIREVADGFEEAFQSFENGEIEFQDLWDYVILQLRRFGNLFQVYVGGPISGLFSALYRAVTGLFTFTVDGAKAMVLDISSFLVSELTKAWIEVTIQANNALADIPLLGIQKIPEEAARQIRAFAGLIADDPLGVEEIIAESRATALEGGREVLGAFSEEWENYTKNREDLQERIKAQEEELNDFVANAAQQRLAEREATNREEIEAERAKTVEIATTLRAVRDEVEQTNLAAEGILDNLDASKVSDLIKNANDASRAVLTSVLETKVAEDFERRKISAEDFFALRKSLETTTADQEIANAQNLLAIERERLINLNEERQAITERRREQEQALETVELLGAEDEYRAEIVAELLQLKKDENEALTATAVSQERIRELSEALIAADLRRLAIQQDLNAEQQSFAETLVGDAGEALARLTQVATETNTALQAGRITQTQAIQATEEAQKKFNQQLDASIATVQALIAASPQLAESFAAVIQKLQNIRESGELQPETADGFFANVSQGAQATANELGNLEKAGQRVGQALTQNLVSGLVDVFVTGTKSMKQFLGEFLITIAKMITELLLYKAIATALGFVGPLPAPAPGGAPVTPLSGGSVGPWGLARRGTGQTPNGAIGGSERPSRSSWVAATALVAALGASSAAAQPIKRLHGGSVPGPAVRRDIIPAMLSPREWVINNAATDYYGDAIMNAINQRAIPRELLFSLGSAKKVNNIMNALGRHQTGGSAGGDAGFTPRELTGSEPSTTRAYLVSDENTMERILSGGRRSMLQFLAENADDVRSAIGR